MPPIQRATGKAAGSPRAGGTWATENEASRALDKADATVFPVGTTGYLAALQCFGLAGARIVPVPTAGIGIDLAALEQLAGLHHPKVCYTVPTFQNPTGRTLDGGQRRELVSLAERYGFWLIEDDPYRELRYSGSPQPPLARFAPHDHVLSTGSLSKIIAPGLRIGWVRTPPVLKPALVVIKQAADLHTSTINQAAAAHYLASGRLPGHLDVMRAEYARRRDALLAALPAALPAGSHWNSPDGGMFVWVVLPEEYDAMERLPAAIGRQVAFVPGAEFYPTDPLNNTMQLSFTTYPADRIAEGVRRLGLAFGAEETQ